MANWLCFLVGLCADTALASVQGPRLSGCGVAVVTRPPGTPQSGPFIPPASIAGGTARPFAAANRRYPSTQPGCVNSRCVRPLGNCAASTPATWTPLVGLEFMYARSGQVSPALGLGMRSIRTRAGHLCGALRLPFCGQLLSPGRAPRGRPSRPFCGDFDAHAAGLSRPVARPVSPYPSLCVRTHAQRRAPFPSLDARETASPRRA